MNATCESTKKFIGDKRRLLSSDIFYRFKYNDQFCEFISRLMIRWTKMEEKNISPHRFSRDEAKIVRMLSEKFISTKCQRDDFERIDNEIKNNPEWSNVWNPRLVNLVIRAIQLGKFREKKDHILTGPGCLFHVWTEVMWDFRVANYDEEHDRVCNESPYYALRVMFSRRLVFWQYFLVHGLGRHHHRLWTYHAKECGWQGVLCWVHPHFG